MNRHSNQHEVVADTATVDAERPRPLTTHLVRSKTIHAASVAVLAAMIAASPPVGDTTAFPLILAAGVGGLGLVGSARKAAVGAQRHRRRSGAGWGLIILAAAAFIGGFGGSIAASVAGRPDLCIVIAAGVFLLIGLTVWADERFENPDLAGSDS